MTNEEIGNIIETALEDALEKIRLNLDEKGINASGRTSEALAVRKTETGWQLGKFPAGERTAPLFTLEIGRPGGNVPGGFVQRKNGELDVSNLFKWILVEWAQNKGVMLDWGGATMLGRRIAAEGTLRHINGGTDVYSETVTDLKKKLTTDLTLLVNTKINQVIKTNF